MWQNNKTNKNLNLKATRPKPSANRSKSKSRKIQSKHRAHQKIMSLQNILFYKYDYQEYFCLTFRMKNLWSKQAPQTSTSMSLLLRLPSTPQKSVWFFFNAVFDYFAVWNFYFGKAYFGQCAQNIIECSSSIAIDFNWSAIKFPATIFPPFSIRGILCAPFIYLWNSFDECTWYFAANY